MITSDLLEAYVACPMKCYLQSNGAKCSENTFAALYQTQKDSYRHASIRRLEADQRAAQKPPFFSQEENDVSGHVYGVNGDYSFYQRGKYLYSAQTNECELYQSGDYFYSMKTNEALLYQSGKYLYSMNGGTASYYFA